MVVGLWKVFCLLIVMFVCVWLCCEVWLYFVASLITFVCRLLGVALVLPLVFCCDFDLILLVDCRR